MFVILILNMDPKKKANKTEAMNIDMQIKDCEEKITRLEEIQRKNIDNPGRVNKVLDEQYEQIALLKIRKMMGY